MVAEKTGWTKKEIIHEHSFSELNFMLADAPKLIKKKPEVRTAKSDDELAAFFQS